MNLEHGKPERGLELKLEQNLYLVAPPIAVTRTPEGVFSRQLPGYVRTRIAERGQYVNADQLAIITRLASAGLLEAG